MIVYVDGALWDRMVRVLPEGVLPGSPGEKWSESGNVMKASQKDLLLDWRRKGEYCKL